MIREPSDSKSFLIVVLRYIGDVLVTTPLALSLKTAFPNAEIDYLVFEGTDKTLKKNPLIRKVITIPRKGKHLALLRSLFRSYDVALAAYASDRSTIAAAVAGKRSIGLVQISGKHWWKRLILDSHRIYDDRSHVVSGVLSLAEELGISPIPRVSMGYSDDDVTFARGAIASDKYILLHPYSMKRYKYWPAENWGRLAALINERTDCTAVFTAMSTPEDNDYLDTILACCPPGVATFPSRTLNIFAASVKGCIAYVGIDTATTHIAAAMEAPTIAIFGPTLTRYWAPWPNGCEESSPFAANKGIQRKGYITVVQKEWDCVPCNQESCAITRRGKMECLEQLTAEEVFNELNNSIHNKRLE